jgi:hypothetical protein
LVQSSKIEYKIETPHSARLSKKKSRGNQLIYQISTKSTIKFSQGHSKVNIQKESSRKSSSKSGSDEKQKGKTHLEPLEPSTSGLSEVENQQVSQADLAFESIEES